MIIEHVGVWVRDLEGMADFYSRHLDAKRGEQYIANHDGFRSIFLYFSCGPRLELMTREGLNERPAGDLYTGWAHITFSVSTREKVDSLTSKLSEAGCEVVSGPRITGDGYYESMIRDPEGNLIEITI